METFFNTFYLWTSGLYSVTLDNYMFETEPGYFHVGLLMLVLSLIITAVFYYVVKPIQKQNFKYFLFMGLNALINFGFAIWYTATPLVNNQIDMDASWTYLDSVFFGVSNAIWSCVFFLVFSFIIKWWSIAKYVPFRKF